MIRMVDSELVPVSMLGAVISALIRAAEADPAVRELIADPESAPTEPSAD